MKKKNNSFIVALFSILVGLIIGGIVLLISGYNPIQAYGIMLAGIFGNFKNISYTILRSTPIIITGISVAFAFRAGLFNIGAEGQFIIGSLAAAIVGYYVNLPPVLHGLVAILAGALAAGLWAGITGVLKSKYEVNEVISAIMLNWIALHLNNYMISRPSFRRPNTDASHTILDSAKINILGSWKASSQGREFLKNNKILGDFLTPSLHYGIFIAIGLAFLVWYILEHTTLGYELKAVGHNKEAAEYAGIDIKKNIIRSLMIAGAIAGIAGATQVLGVNYEVGILNAAEGYGFDGMAVSLIGRNHPLATIPAGLLFGALKYGGQKLNSSSLKAPSEVINIMIGIIIIFIAMPKLFDLIKEKTSKEKRGEDIE